jgi:Raf kinase inhibitor-like YbhB/YbcL family protein
MAEKQKWPPATQMRSQPIRGTDVPLALERPETRSEGRIEVRSATIHGEIPALHSEYADGVSPALAWNRVEGAQSYALVMEDPDATSVNPFVHWVAWNIPADTTTLPEGLSGQPRLTEPEGILQGRTSRGSVGYFGPRPPVGDPPHHYHFQVFALDTTLDLPAGAKCEKLFAAMRGHVIAAGELVGTYQQPFAPSA